MIKVKRNKVVEKGDSLEAGKGEKVFTCAEDLYKINNKTLCAMFNNVTNGSISPNTMGDMREFCDTLFQEMDNYEIPVKPEKAPRAPKEYNIPEGATCKEYRPGTKLHTIVEALVKGATFAQLAEIADTKEINVKHRVLRLLPKAGYGIYNKDDVFFVVIPPYEEKPVKEKPAKKEKAAKAA